MRHGSLFSGIGGFDLAAEWMGWENVFHCEWNPFGQKVLKYYFPKAISYDNITKTDFTIHRGNIDLISGGFPCQPYSSAGKRKGKEDERHLWPQMLRAIREIAPSWVVGENVYGLVNWSGGLVFHEVQADLEAEGYEVFPFLLPAVSVNAPHRRDRIWFVAHNNSINGFGEKRQLVTQQEHRRFVSEIQGTLPEGVVAHTTRTSERTDELSSIRPEDGEIGGERTQTIYDAIRPDGTQGVATNSLCDRVGESREGRQSEQFNENGIKRGTSAYTTNIGQEYALENGELEGRRFGQSNKRNTWDSFPSVSPICIGDDGLSNRLDSITFPKWRNESIKAGGNAIVPQVVYQIFKSIEQYEREHNSRPD